MNIFKFISNHKFVILLVLLITIWVVLSLSFPETSKNSPQLSTSQSPTYTPPQQINTTDKFEIIYTDYNQLYLISILAAPYGTYRLEAEKALIKSLNLTESTACGLKVLISQPFYIEQKIQPEYTKLSFCPQT